MSSSAQLTLLPRLLGWDPPRDRTGFAAGLHAGSAVGVALAMRPEIRALRAPDVRRMAAASVPAAVTGLLLQDVVERRLGTTRGIAVGLVLGGAALLWADTRPPPPSGSRDVLPHSPSGDPATPEVLPPRRRPATPTTAAALAQVVALVPGVSRQGAVLTALRASGVDRAAAARTSLVMSLPVSLGAAGLTAVRGRALPPLVPALAAAATAYAAARRARWTGNSTKAAVVVRMGVAAAAVAQDRRRT